MAFSSGTATSLTNLLATLDTFLVANGWNQDEVNVGTGRYAWSKNTMFLSVRWDTSTPNNLGLYYATAWVAATDPGNHTGDDGQGDISGTDTDIDNGRYVQLGNAGSIPYWFFEQDASPAYVHIVVEKAAGQYRHFGFGELIKTSAWSGGDYCYGHHIETLFAGDKFVPLDTRHVFHLDGMNSTLSFDTNRNPTVKITNGVADFGLAAGIDWGYINGDFTETIPNDRNGDPKARVHGGFRGGPWAKSFGYVQGNALSGLVHMYPVTIALKVSNNIFVLGTVADTRGISMRLFAAEQTFTYGGDTWHAFPMTTKDTDTEFGNMQGIAYKEVVA